MSDKDKSAAITPESGKSNIHDLLAKFEPTNSFSGETVKEEETIEGLLGDFSKTTKQDALKEAKPFTTQEEHAQAAQDLAKREEITGFDFNYEYMGGRNFMSQDLHELQAERQGTWDKTKRGFARLGGEFVLNVLETPGVVGGAIGALFTGDINTMTDNAWVNTIESAKEALTDYNQVYVRKYVEEGGIADKMLSADWLATEGASAAAFMGAALVPGLGVTKLGKTMGLVRGLSKAGKWGAQSVRWGDNVAVKLGAISAKAAKQGGIGTGAAALNGLVTTTAVNTIYEAGVEARGAQQAFEAQLETMYLNGELKASLKPGEDLETKYAQLKEESKVTAKNVFNANVGILAIPNMIMSKALLGPRGGVLSSLKGRMTMGADGTILDAGADAARRNATNFVSKLATNPIAKGAGSVVTSFGKNTFREGVWEEMAQMTAENYLGKDYLQSIISGERKRGLVETYLDVAGSTEGQVAAITAGILSGPVSIYSSRQEKKQFEADVKFTISSYNLGMSLHRAARQPLYKTDKEGNPVYAKDKDGNVTPQRELDPVAIEQLAKSQEQHDLLTHDYNVALSKGQHSEAAVIASRIQAQAFIPFIMNGREGIQHMEDFMKELPNIDNVVGEYNKLHGTDLTKETYIKEEVRKAEDLLKKSQYFDTYIAAPTTHKWDKNHIPEATEELAEKTKTSRHYFNMAMNDNYVQASAEVAEIDRQIEKVNDGLAEAENNDAAAATIERLNKEKKALTKEREGRVVFKQGLEDADIYEAKWTEFFNQTVQTEKFDDKELVDFLDKVIVDIKGATSIEEIGEVVSKAREAGLVVPTMEYTHIPEEVERMAQSNDALEAFGAYMLLSSYVGTEYSAKAEAAKKNALELLANMPSVFVQVVEATKMKEENLAALASKLESYEKDVIKVEETLSSITEEINKHYASAGKASDTASFNKVLRALTKSRRDATKVLVTVQKDIAKTKSAIDKEARLISANESVMDAIIKNEPNQENKAAWTKLVDGGLSVADNNFVLEQAPLRVSDVIIAAKRNKQLVINNLDGIKSAVLSAAHLEALAQEKKAFTEVEESLKSHIDKVDKLIQKANKITDKVEKDAFLASLNDELDLLNDNLSRVSQHLAAIEKTLNSSDIMLSTDIRAMDDIVKAMDDIVNGVADFESAKSPEKALANMQKLVDTYNIAGTIVVTEFLNAKNDILGFEAQLPNAKAYITYLEGKFKVKEFGEVKSYQEFSEFIAEEKEKALAEIGGDELKTSTALALRIIKESDYEFEIPTGHRFIEYSKFGPVYKLLLNRDSNKLAALSGKVLTMLEKDPTNLNLLKTINLLNTYLGNRESLYPGEVAKNIILNSEEILSAQEESFKEAFIRDKAPEQPADPTTATIAGLENENIRNTIAKLVQVQRDKLTKGALRLAMKEFENALATSKAFWHNIIKGEKFIAVGNNVDWSIEGKQFTGRVEAFIKNKGGDNALVKEEDGTLHVLPVSAISKSERSVLQENNASNTKHSKTTDKNKGTIVGGNEYVSLSVMSDKHPSYKGPVKVLDPTSGEVVTSPNALLAYLEEPRDKSRDVVTFSMPLSKLKGELQSAQNKGLHIMADEYTKTIAAYEALQAGSQLSKEQYELLVDNVNMSFRVTREGGKGAAGGTIYNKHRAGENFNGLEKTLREKILSDFIQNKGQLGKNGTLTGVEGRFGFTYTGKLNIEGETTKNKLSDLRGVTLDNMTLFIVDNIGKKIDNNGSKGIAPASIASKTGGVYLTIKDNNGKDFNLRAKTSKLEGSRELDVLMSIFRTQIAIAGSDLSAQIDEKTRKYLNSNMPLLAKALGADITYQKILSTLLFAGNEHSQTFVKYNNRNNTLQIGDNVWTGTEIVDNHDAIKAVLGHKLMHVNFPTGNISNNNGVNTTSKEYMEYIIEGSLVTTELKADAPLFVGEEKDGFVKGISPYISANEISFNKKDMGDTKEGPKKSTVPGKKTILSSTIKRTLKKQGVDVKSLSESAKEFIAMTFKSATGLTVEKLQEYNNKLTQAQKDAGNEEIKIKCKK